MSNAFLLNIRQTAAYVNLVKGIVKAAQDNFFFLMKKSPEERKAFFQHHATHKFPTQVLDAWTDVDGRLDDGGDYQLKLRNEIENMAAADAMDTFVEDLNDVIKKIMEPTKVEIKPEPPQVVAPPPEPVAEPAPSYPAPNAFSMALDPVSPKGIEIPPLQTRNFFTLPKHERAKMMPTQSVEADDMSWLNNSVYNQGG